MKELTASKGYIVDVTAHNVTVEPEKTAAVTVTEVSQSNPMDLLLQKLDKERKKAEPQGNASLAEAQFIVKFYTEQSDTDPAASGAKPARTWIFKTDAEGKAHFSKSYLVSGAAFYTQTDGKTPCLPLGTVTVQETKAPAGYFVNDTVFVQKITAGGTTETVSCYNVSSVEEQIYRGGVRVQKRDLETKKAEAEGSVELSFTFDASALRGKTIVAFESVSYQEKEVAVHADIESAPQSIYFPEIGTTAKDGKDGDQEVLAEKDTQLVDTVEYKGLVTKDMNYRLVGILMNKETGKEVQIDEKPVPAETTFQPEKAEGTVDVIFHFDATTLKGHDVVVFEKLYVTTKDGDKEKEVELTSHEDIEAKSQTVKLTEVPTEPEKTPDAPKTGDTTNLWIPIAVLVAAFAGIIVVLIRIRRKKF